MMVMFASLDMLMFYLFLRCVDPNVLQLLEFRIGKRQVMPRLNFLCASWICLMLVCMLLMYINAGTTDIPLLVHQFTDSLQFWLFLGFLASFAVKVPMWPVHTWLPDAMLRHQLLAQ